MHHIAPLVLHVLPQRYKNTAFMPLAIVAILHLHHVVSTCMHEIALVYNRQLRLCSDRIALYTYICGTCVCVGRLYSLHCSDTYQLWVDYG